MTVILAAIDKLCRLLSSLFVVAMMSVVSLQVFARFCLPSCPSWTEELARIFYIHIIGFAGPIALRNDLLVNVDIVLNFLPRRLGLATRIFNRLVVFAVCVVFTYASYRFVISGMREKSVALVWPMAIPFSALLVSAALMTLFCAEGIIRDCRSMARGKEAAAC